MFRHVSWIIVIIHDMDLHLASWAGTAPGCIESAGKVQSTKTRHGNRYLKGALGLAALAASRSKGNLTRCQPHRLPGGT